MKKKMVKMIFPVLLLTFSLPSSVAAQNIDDTETSFVGTTESDTNEGGTASDNVTAPAEDEKKDSEETRSDLDGFISGDDSSENGNNKTLHVIIENGNMQGNTEENPSGSDNSSDINNDDSSGGEYSGYTGGDSSVDSGASSSAEKIYHKPQVLLEENNLNGQSIKAGSSMEMSVTFRNKSRSQNVFGLKISLSTETKGIEFEKNSFYVQRLTPGEAITLKQTITVTKDCDPGQASISFSLDYEDSRATGATGSEALTFLVTQPALAKLEASDIPSVFYTMDTVEIPVKAMNLGRDKIYNATVKLEADGLTSKETAFLGTVDAGTAADGSLRVYVKGTADGTAEETKEENISPGKIKGKLLLTYEDAAGNSYEAESEFESEIKEARIQSLKVDDENEETNGWWYSIFAVAAVLLIAVILFLLAILHKKTVLLEEARKAEARKADFQ